MAALPREKGRWNAPNFHFSRRTNSDFDLQPPLFLRSCAGELQQLSSSCNPLSANLTRRRRGSIERTKGPRRQCVSAACLAAFWNPFTPHIIKNNTEICAFVPCKKLCVCLVKTKILRLAIWGISGKGLADGLNSFAAGHLIQVPGKLSPSTHLQVAGNQVKLESVPWLGLNSIGNSFAARVIKSASLDGLPIWRKWSHPRAITALQLH